MDINQIHDPYEDPADTEDTDSMPSSRPDRLRARLLMQKSRIRKFIYPIPPYQPSTPGLAYLESSKGHSEIHWLSNKILYHPAFRYALLDTTPNHFNRFNAHRSDIEVPYFKGNQVFTVMGSVGAFATDGCTDVNRVWQTAYDSELDVHFLLKFDDDEGLAAFKQTQYYRPFHLFVPPPAPDTDAVFEDDDYAQITGWKLTLGEDYSDSEIHGIAAHYKNFEKMSMIFLGDTTSLNDIYRRIGGKIDYEWRVHCLRQLMRERKGL